MIRIILFVSVIIAETSIASAEPYWIAYEGDDFPENVGWYRIYGNEDGWHGGGAERSIEDGVFVLDSLRHDKIYDFYEISRPIDPGPGETFLAEWRIQIDESDPYYDAAVVIARDEPAGHISIKYEVDLVTIATDGVALPIEPGVFHTYRIESSDMVSFELFIDGLLAHNGVFDDVSLLKSFVRYGDGIQGSASLSRWDYFRFGAVPEPATALLLITCLYGIRSRR